MSARSPADTDLPRASFRCDNMKPMWKPAALAADAGCGHRPSADLDHCDSRLPRHTPDPPPCGRHVRHRDRHRDVARAPLAAGVEGRLERHLPRSGAGRRGARRGELSARSRVAHALEETARCSATKPRTTGIRSIRIAQRARDSYLISLTLIGVDMSQLLLRNPVCQPLAVIVGDDDGFTGADLMTRPAF